MPEPLFIQCEDGQKHITAYKTPLITEWSQFTELLKELMVAVGNGNCPYKTLVIDTVDRMVQLCADHVCMKEGIDDLSEQGFGRAYAKVAGRMEHAFYMFAKLGLGLIMISHQREVTIKSATGDYIRQQPDMSPSIAERIIG